MLREMRVLGVAVIGSGIEQKLKAKKTNYKQKTNSATLKLIDGWIKELSN